MFAKAIRKERGNLSINMFARSIGTAPESVEAWESGRLPKTQSFNRLVRELGWNDKKASKMADWIEEEREQQKINAKHDRTKAYAFNKISDIVLNGSGSLSDIDLIVNETLEVIIEV